MKKFRKLASLLMLTAAVVFAAGCTKPDEPNNGENGGNNGGNNGGGNNDEPTATVTVEVLTPENVKHTTALLGAKATLPEGETYTQFAICWGTEENPEPTWGNSIFEDDEAMSFDTLVFEFEPGTTYHVRAYLRCGQDEYYSEDKTFTTLALTDMSVYGNINGYPCVDLGLPGGTQWAVYNVGASSPIEYGSYFAWGETTEKTEYTWNNYKFGDYYADDEPTKYNVYDNLTTLQAEDDAVAANWHGGWHTPTNIECYELRDNAFHEKWYTVNEVSGMLLTFKNGNSIFLPAGGEKEDVLIWDNTYCVYPSSSLSVFNGGDPNSWSMVKLTYTEYQSNINSYMRNSGFTYRGVHSAN